MRVGTCAFCDRRTGGRGEHVYPRWFLERWEGQGAFTRVRDGSPIVRRDGTPQQSDEMPPVTLRVCGSNSPNDCNGWLHTTFEVPAKPAVRLAMDAVASIDADGTLAFAQWWVKTLLLAHHPAALDSFHGGHPPETHTWSRWPGVPSLLPAMRWTGLLPSDLTLWVTVHDVSSIGQLPEPTRILLPRVSRPDDEGGQGESCRVGVSLGDGRAAVFQLVHHPLCDIDHPFEEARFAIRLWPDPPASLDFATLPTINTIGMSQLGRLFVKSGSVAHIPVRNRLHLHADDASVRPCLRAPE